MHPKLDTKGFGYFGIDPNAAADGEDGNDLSLALMMPTKDLAAKRRTDERREKPASVGHINLFDVPDQEPSLPQSRKVDGKPKSKGIKGIGLTVR